MISFQEVYFWDLKVKELLMKNSIRVIIKRSEIQTLSKTHMGKIHSLVMGPGQNILTRVGSAIYGLLGFGFGKFPLKMSNFSIFFPLGQKKKSDWVKK